MKHDASNRKGAKDEWWPLVVAFCIALPLTALFAYGLARGTEEHEVRPVLGLYFIALVCVPIIVVGLLSVVKWWRKRQAERALLRPGDHRDVWQQPTTDDHLDSWFDPSSPEVRRDEESPAGFAPGPGLSRLRRYRKPIPKPKRRI